jgi:Uma2 family endonuclease
VSTDLSSLEGHSGEWTTDDLDQLPESHTRYELVDGALFVQAPSSNVHQTVVVRLVEALSHSCPGEYAITHAVELRVTRTRSFIPDVLVISTDSALPTTSKFAPRDVVLIVEVVEESSTIMDRAARPLLYAQAGVPFYWRVETRRGISVVTHRLDPGAELYELTGEFSDRVITDQPWPIDFPVSRLVPKHYRPE